MTAKELIAAAQQLSQTLTPEDKTRLFQKAMEIARLRDEERALTLRVTREDLERAYSL